MQHTSRWIKGTNTSRLKSSELCGYVLFGTVLIPEFIIDIFLTQGKIVRLSCQLKPVHLLYKAKTDEIEEQ